MYMDVIVVHVRDVPHPDGVDQEFEVIYPETFDVDNDVPPDFESVEEWVLEELRNPKKWKCILSVEDDGFDYIEVYKKVSR